MIGLSNAKREKWTKDLAPGIVIVSSNDILGRKSVFNR